MSADQSPSRSHASICARGARGNRAGSGWLDGAGGVLGGVEQQPEAARIDSARAARQAAQILTASLGQAALRGLGSRGPVLGALAPLTLERELGSAGAGLLGSGVGAGEVQGEDDGEDDRGDGGEDETGFWHGWGCSFSGGRHSGRRVCQVPERRLGVCE